MRRTVLRAIRSSLVTMTIALSLAPGTGFAQPIDADDDGPVVVGEPREALEAFRFDRLDLSLDFYLRYRHDELSNTGVPDRTNEEVLLRETLGVSTRFFVGHRNLIDFTGDASIGFQQEFIDNESTGIDGEDNTFVNFFNAEALIFGAGPAPLTLYGRRNETQLDRAFAGSVDNELTEFGASIRLFRNTAPTSLRYFHREQSYEDTLGTVDDNLTQDTFQLQTVWASGVRHRLLVDYAFDMIDEERLRGFSDRFDRHDATVTHDFRFGQDNRHSLRSTGRFFSESGDRDQQLLRLHEILTLHHSNTLESRYQLTLEDRSVRSQDRFFARGNAQVTHRLWESLTTTAVIGGSHTSLRDDNFTSNQVFGSVEWNYTKEVPYGRFDATLSLGFDVQDDSELGDTVAIQDRPAVFNDPRPILLPQRNIEENSIMVMDVSGLRTFEEGRDYTVMVFPDRAEIRRVVGGQIADGQAVLLDFDIGPQPAVTTTSLLAAIALRYSIQEGMLRGLAIYGDFRDTNQSLESQDPLVTPNDVRIYRAGIEYRRTPFYTGFEFERREATISPFDSFRLWARYDQRLGPRSVLSIHASHEIYDYTDEDNTIELDRILGEWRQGFDAGLDLRLQLLYRNERDDLAGDSQGFEQVFELNWIKRQTRIFLSVKNSILDSDNEDSLSQTLAFGFTRRF